MTNLILNPYGNTCKVTLDIPWDLAETLVAHGPQLIEIIKQALDTRKEEARDNHKVKEVLDKQCEDNRAAWAALAEQCEAEIAKRSNAPGQRRQILKQLAAEYKVAFPFLDSICRVYGSQKREAGIAARKAEIIRLHLSGLSHKQIAQEVKLTPESVGNIIVAERDLIGTLKAHAHSRPKIEPTAGSRP